jgi:hypothetical protein
METPYPHLTLTKELDGRRYSNSDQFTMQIKQGTTVVASTTTDGRRSTVEDGSTPQYQATAGTAYTMDEVGYESTNLTRYKATMACSNGNGSSNTILPTQPGDSVTPALGDVIECIITNSRLTTAFLTISKTVTPVSDPVNGTINPKLIPGAIAAYSFVVSNTGPDEVDTNTVWLISEVPSNLLVGTAASPVFVQGSPSSGLSFNAGTGIKFSNAASSPSSFAACNYTPTSPYDANVRYVCLNLTGTMQDSNGTPPSFTLTIQAQVK